MNNRPSEYKAPILTQIYQVAGALALVGSAAMFISMLARDGGRNAEVAAFYVLFFGVAVCLVCFGIAQVVNYIGQTAHNTREIAELLRGRSDKEEVINPFVRTEPSLRRTIAPKVAIFLLAATAFANAQVSSEDAFRLSKIPRSLVHGKILSVSAEGYLVSCDAAKISHPAMPNIAVDVRPSQDRLVWIARDATTPQWGEGSSLNVLAKEDGTHTYRTVLQKLNTVANFVGVEIPAPYSVIALLDRDGKVVTASLDRDGKPQPTPIPGPPRSQFGTVMDTPRYNL